MSKATHTGECGLCGRRFNLKTKKPGTVDRKFQTMAKHGFNRPGVGYIVGQCPGSHKLPVELSTETIELAIQYAQNAIKMADASIAHLESCTEIPWFYNARIGFGRFDRKMESVTLVKGQPSPYVAGWCVPSFEREQSNRLNACRGNKEMATAALHVATTRLAAWKPSNPTSIA
jgi:hypothetical protein